MVLYECNIWIIHSHVSSVIICHYPRFIIKQCIRQEHFLIRGTLYMSLLSLSLFYQRSHQSMLWLGKLDRVWGWNESNRSMIFLKKRLAEFPSEVLVYHPEALRLFFLFPFHKYSLLLLLLPVPPHHLTAPPDHFPYISFLKRTSLPGISTKYFKLQ